jgi:hypothetical protein
MNKLFLLVFFTGVIVISGLTFAQSAPVLYFCEKYDSVDGEVGVSDRFSPGYLTIVVKCDHELRLSNVHIQFDKYDAATQSFSFYKKFNFTVEPAMNYVYFSRNEESDMSFDEPGMYRVYLLNNEDNTVTSGLVQIVE